MSLQGSNVSSFSTIACCIDLTEQNDDIVNYTREMAELTGAKILLVHVLPPTGAFASYGASKELLQKVAAESRVETEKYVKDFAAKYFAGLPCEPLIMTGHIDKALNELVDKRCADLIIMGSLNTRGLFNFSGSTSRLIGRSRVPVMVIPNDLSLECEPDENF